ncbi:MAG: HIT domain-containing protein [Rhodanobacteraceae bacterium]
MSEDAETHFELDPRLARDTTFIADWPLCRVLLMDDARFPWLVLVPRRAHLFDLDDMIDHDQIDLLGEINRALSLLRWRTGCDKLNVGALGNIVRQLHVHVVARHQGDAAWPGPVWGHGSAEPYPPDRRDRLVALLSREDPAEVEAPACILRRSDDD